MRRALLFFFGGVLVLAAVAVIGSYTFIPPLVENLAAKSIQSNLNLKSAPKVRLRSDPPPNILCGRFSGGEVDISGATFGPLKTENVRARLGPFDVNVPASLRTGVLVPQKGVSGELRVRISGKEVRRLAEKRGGISGVGLSGGQVVVKRSPKVFGLPIPVEVRGEISVRGGRFAFRPEGLSVADVPLPANLRRNVLGGTVFSFPVEGLPEGMTLKSAEVRGSDLVITGKIKNILRSAEATSG